MNVFILSIDPAHDLQKGLKGDVVSLASVAEMKNMKQDEGGVTTGAAVTLTDFQKGLQRVVNSTEGDV